MTLHICKYCNYSTQKKALYDEHTTRPKHKNNFLKYKNNNIDNNIHIKINKIENKIDNKIDNKTPIIKQFDWLQLTAIDHMGNINPLKKWVIDMVGSLY